MELTENEIIHRRPVWDALSTLFLDTDVSLLRDSRVSTLAQSKYTIQELQDILVSEVYPVCRINLLQIAGEWAGFDIDWLESNIRKRKTSSLKFLHGLNLGKITVHLSIEWHRTKKAIYEFRQGKK